MLFSQTNCPILPFRNIWHFMCYWTCQNSKGVSNFFLPSSVIILFFIIYFLSIYHSNSISTASQNLVQLITVVGIVGLQVPLSISLRLFLWTLTGLSKRYPYRTLKTPMISFWNIWLHERVGTDKLPTIWDFMNLICIFTSLTVLSILSCSLVRRLKCSLESKVLHATCHLVMRMWWCIDETNHIWCTTNFFIFSLFHLPLANNYRHSTATNMLSNSPPTSSSNTSLKVATGPSLLADVSLTTPH